MRSNNPKKTPTHFFSFFFPLPYYYIKLIKESPTTIEYYIVQEKNIKTTGETFDLTN